MKAIILARVSAKKQDSNEAQIFRISDYVKYKNLEVWKTYEIEESSTKGDRKRFQEIVKVIQEQKEPIALVVDTVDRLQRSFKESVQLDEMRKLGKIEIHFYRENLVINQHSNSADLLRWDMGVMFARSYVLQLSDNVKRKQEIMRRNGEWTGKVRLGYLNYTDENDKAKIKINIAIRHLMVEIFELYATYLHSMQSVADIMNKKGLRTQEGNLLRKSNIEKILKDPFYYGQPYSKKYGLYPKYHNYGNIIDKALFDKCQEIINKKRKVVFKTVAKEYIFSGLLKCQNCGCAISPEQKVKKSGKTYNYYSCTNGKGICKRIYATEKELLGPILAKLKLLSKVSAKYQEKLVAEIRKTTDIETEYHKAEVKRITSELEKLRVHKENLKDAIIDKSITRDDYDKRLQTASDKEQILCVELEEHLKADTDYKTTVGLVFSVACRANEIFESSEPSEKRQLLSYLLQNPLVNGKTLYFTMRSPFNLLLQLEDSKAWLPDRDSNPN